MKRAAPSPTQRPPLPGYPHRVPRQASPWPVDLAAALLMASGCLGGMRLGLLAALRLGGDWRLPVALGLLPPVGAGLGIGAAHLINARLFPARPAP